MKKVNGIRIFFILTVLFWIGCYQIVLLREEEEPIVLPSTEQTEIAEEPETETQEAAALPVSRTIDRKSTRLNSSHP